MDQIVILAAGKGTRMHSDKPKVLHEVKGVPMIQRLLNNLKPVFDPPIVVVGYGSDAVRSALKGTACRFVHQSEQLGTGHAVWCAKEMLADGDAENTVVIPGDHPLLSAKTLKRLLRLHKERDAKISLALVSVPCFEGDFYGFHNCGRIIRSADGNVEGIIELKDADDEQKKITEVNVSYYCFDSIWLWKNIERLRTENATREYYLTDMVRIASEQGDEVAALVIENPYEGLGVNDQEQLSIVEAHCQ